MRKFTAVVVTILVALALAPSEARAIPRPWRNTPTVTVGGNTYRVRDKGHVAVLVKTRGTSVTIPREIRARGKYYEVRGVWDTALRGARKVEIHAKLECCESPQLWRKGVRVRVTDRGVYQWLKRTGVRDLQLIRCKYCK